MINDNSINSQPNQAANVGRRFLVDELVRWRSSVQKSELSELVESITILVMSLTFLAWIMIQYALDSHSAARAAAAKNADKSVSCIGGSPVKVETAPIASRPGQFSGSAPTKQQEGERR